MAAGPISTPAQVQNVGGRIGVCLYDNPNVLNNSNASAIIIFSDGTYSQEPRANLSVLSGLPAFFQGSGPGN